eukprot:12694063-Alexandrium_andersonii.AAC.1
MASPASSAKALRGVSPPMARRTVASSAWRVGKTADAPRPRARRWRSWEAAGAGGGTSSAWSALGVAS